MIINRRLLYFLISQVGHLNCQMDGLDGLRRMVSDKLQIKILKFLLQTTGRSTCEKKKKKLSSMTMKFLYRHSQCFVNCTQVQDPSKSP